MYDIFIILLSCRDYLFYSLYYDLIQSISNIVYIYNPHNTFYQCIYLKIHIYIFII